jgi:hypothetical protein
MAPELAGGAYPRPDEDATPIAWRCEQCKKLQPTNVPSHVIHIDEVQSAWAGTTVRRHARFIRRVVVCPPCRRSIAGMQESSNDG